MQQELQQAPTTPAETEPEVDLDFAPTDEGNVDPPMVLSNDAPEAPAVAVDDGVRRSTRVHTQAKPTYIPTMTGKKYSFATTVLGGTMLGDEAYEYNQGVAYSFMQQLSVKAALKQWGDDARVAGRRRHLSYIGERRLYPSGCLILLPSSGARSSRATCLW